MIVTYSINGKPVTLEELRNVKITRKDYIEYVENIKKEINQSRQASNDMMCG